MVITIACRELDEDTEDLERRIQALSKRLARYFVSVQNIAWDARREGEACSIRLTLHARSGHFMATADAVDPVDAASEAFKKVVKQRRRAKEKRVGARRKRMRPV